MACVIDGTLLKPPTHVAHTLSLSLTHPFTHVALRNRKKPRKHFFTFHLLLEKTSMLCLFCKFEWVRACACMFMLGMCVCVCVRERECVRGKKQNNENSRLRWVWKYSLDRACLTFELTQGSTWYAPLSLYCTHRHAHTISLSLSLSLSLQNRLKLRIRRQANWVAKERKWSDFPTFLIGLKSLWAIASETPMFWKTSCWAVFKQPSFKLKCPCFWFRVNEIWKAEKLS